MVSEKLTAHSLEHLLKPHFPGLKAKDVKLRETVVVKFENSVTVIIESPSGKVEVQGKEPQRTEMEKVIKGEIKQ